MSDLTGPEPERPVAGPAADDAPGAAVASASGRRRGWLVLTLLVLVIALAATSVWLAVGAYNRGEDAAARADALQASRQTVQNFVSISAATIDRDLQRVSDGATGDFADEFGRGKAQVKSVVVANKVASEGQVLESAVVSSDRDSASVLVIVDAKVTNVSAPKGQLRHYRIKVDLAKVDNDWRVATLKFVG
jgi:Mce-associated membrane protein